MSSKLLEIILSDDRAVRDTPLERACGELSFDQLLAECAALDAFRRECDNLYQRVRALFFLYAIHRFHLPPHLESRGPGHTPEDGFEHLLERRFHEAIDSFLAAADGGARLNDTLGSALASAYYQLGLQFLANQVRASVRSVRGNQWMFRMGRALDHPLRFRRELFERRDGLYPVLNERTAVRMDLSHSSWSDIFFLGMDYPEGARVLNVSIDLAVRDRDPEPRPPIDVSLRVIDEPAVRLVSVDLAAEARITELGDIFDFAKDYLGLLKAALIASGVVPIGLEGSASRLEDLLEKLVGPGRGIELVSSVNNIPKGSRLAVSTNLLAALISVCMRATGQTVGLDGTLLEKERRLVAARAILGEWLGGSGGGWQDSGGVWPGIKVISGALAEEDDPEFGVSRGRLLPSHRLIGTDEVSDETRAKLQDSLVLVHGGMAQNVGPILEMVTEKYLLRGEREWAGRMESLRMFDEILDALRAGDIRELGRLTTAHFEGPLQTIIPWATTFFTERLIEQARDAFGDRFWGFWMLGGMSGGGMGFIFDPEVKDEARSRMREILAADKARLEKALPFAMDPVVYDFAINGNGSAGAFLKGGDALMPPPYYPLVWPKLLRRDPREVAPAQKAELSAFQSRSAESDQLRSSGERLFANLFPQEQSGSDGADGLDGLLVENGFDHAQHETIRDQMRRGLIGLSKNRLPANTTVADVRAEDITGTDTAPGADREAGRKALENGEAAVVTLAAGAGSRWTMGAGVVKAINPFCQFGGRHRTFLEIHLAKSRRIGRAVGAAPAHVFTTSYLTHGPIADYLEAEDNYGFEGALHLSQGRSIGLRMIPMERDLRFAWEEMPQQILDERAQKVRESLNEALIGWARGMGEASDYRDNLPLQCLHPVGHWFEIPNLLLNGTLRKMLEENPRLRTLLMHNIDTMGANLDPAVLGLHRRLGAALSFEVIPRRIEDRGGGLARVDGRVRLIEGLALPRESDELKLRFYNSATNWIEIDPLLDQFGLTRADLADPEKVAAAARAFALRLPTSITLKDVKKRWGHGQEDIYPVAQFEKLWGDMTAVPEIDCAFLAVPRLRGQQLKDQAQLDGWVRDGSRDYVEGLCEW